MRLIDELTLQRELFCRIQENAIDSGTVHFDSYKNWCLSGSEVEKAISDIFSQVDPFCPTIDPEALPIVQELRSINKRLKAVVKVQLEQLREKTSVIDELCEKVADLDEKLYWVTKERDAALKQISDTCDCDTCKHTGCIQRGGTGCGQ